MRRRRLITMTLLAPLADAHAAETLVRVETALGAFVIAVDPAVAPVTVANFLAYVDAGQLDGGSVYRLVNLGNQPPETRHRIEVVQWGRGQGRKPGDDTPSPRPPIAHETTAQTGLTHRDMTVSMARLAPGSASAEFFICIGDQPSLDFGGGRNPDGQGFAAFGRVVAGQEVVRALHARAGAGQFLQEAIPVRRVARTLQRSP